MKEEVTSSNSKNFLLISTETYDGRNKLPTQRKNHVFSKKEILCNGDLWDVSCDFGHHDVEDEKDLHCVEKKAPDTCVVFFFGRDERGKSVCLRTKTWMEMTLTMSTRRSPQVAFSSVLRRFCYRYKISMKNVHWEIKKMHPMSYFLPNESWKKNDSDSLPDKSHVKRGHINVILIWFLDCRAHSMFKSFVRNNGNGKCNNSFELKIVEASIPQPLRLLQKWNIQPGSVVTLNYKIVGKELEERQKMTLCDREYACCIKPWKSHKFTPCEPTCLMPMFPPQINDDDVIAWDKFPVVYMSFDIETFRDNGRGVPNAPNKGDKVISICSTLMNSVEKKKYFVIHALKEFTHLAPEFKCEENGETEGVIIIQEHFKDEMSLLESFRDTFIGVHPKLENFPTIRGVDVAMHYNGDSYDWPFIFKRANFLTTGVMSHERENSNGYIDYDIIGCESRFFFLSRIIFHRCVLKTQVFSSKAHGTQKSQKPHIPGITNVDMYTLLKRNLQYKHFKSFKLDYVSQKILGKRKNDLSIRKMRECFISNNSDMNSLIQKYCIQDTILPLDLWLIDGNWEFTIQLSKITMCFPSDVLSRGQSFKVTCQLFAYARKMNHVLDNHPFSSKYTNYKGAKVFDIERGLYRRVFVLDYASLYPSIMIAKNICMSSIIYDDDLKKLDGLEFETYKTDIGEFSFQKTIPGIIPQLLSDMYKQRKIAKRNIKVSKKNNDVRMTNVYTARSNAIKVCMNSVYGFLGASINKLSCIPAAASITTIGRNLIKRTKLFYEETYGAKIIGGDTDSVFVQFPLSWSLDKCFQKAHESAKIWSDKHEESIVLEMEKMMEPVVFLQKKKYAALSTEINSLEMKHYKIDIKGLSVIRTDYCDYHQKTYMSIIRNTLITCKNMMTENFNEKLCEEILTFLRDRIHNLSIGKIDKRELSLSKRLAESYKTPQPQSIVATMMKNRELKGGEVIAPVVGERVHYIVVFRRNKRKLIDRVESTNYVIANDIKVDYGYYIKALESDTMMWFECIGCAYSARCLFQGYIARANLFHTDNTIFGDKFKWKTLNSLIPIRKQKEKRIGGKKKKRFSCNPN
jgi:DNA polymerase elongation subunit (family B)